MPDTRKRMENLTWPQRMCDLHKRQAVVIAFILMLFAGVGASYWAARQGQESGAKAGQIAASEVVRRESQTFAYELAVNERNAQVQSCIRVNRVRVENNRRADLHAKQNEAIRKIAEGAREARLRSYRESGAQYDLDAARTYQQARDLVDSIKFTKIPPVDCEKLIPMPPRPSK